MNKVKVMNDRRSPVDCLVVTEEQEAFNSVSDVMSYLGLSTGWVGDLDSLLVDLGSNEIQSSFLMINVDGWGGVPSIIDRLFKIREARPNLPVILTSRSFRRNDLGTDRLAVADVSVRFPVGRASIAAAIGQAAVNNQTWVDRYKEFLNRTIK